jgi:simple sugar transport system permease protein
MRFLRSDTGALTALLFILVAGFGLYDPRFFTLETFGSIGFQLPLLGILTFAMLAPVISGGLNLAITTTANMAGLTLAWVLLANGGPDAPVWAFALGALAALAVGAAAGATMGAVIAFVGAHPILVSLAMMIFLRGLGEFLTRGGDISGFPPVVQWLGYGSVGPIPVPLILFGLVAALWWLILTRSRHGFATYLTGSNPRAADYAGLPVKRTLILIYALSGVLAAVAGILMAARFSSVRVGQGESMILVTVLACFLAGIDPFGGAGRVIPVVMALIILQVLQSGLNITGANQHLATAVWGLFLIGVMILRSGRILAGLGLRQQGKD